MGNLKPINHILIANRGEIAVRIIRTCKKMGIIVSVIYATDDADSMHVTMADHAIEIGSGTLADTYLNIHKIISISSSLGVDAIHPGYGMLSENPEFTSAVEKAGFIFIGPSSSTIKEMGNKVHARKIAQKCNVPVIKGISGSTEELLLHAQSMKFPLLIKAAAGGGGKGMRVAFNERELPDLLQAASREGLSYFGNKEIYIEEYLNKPRHIEVQLLADNFSNVIHLYDRECSLQRRHQKVVEEAPVTSISLSTREKMYQSAIKIAQFINYNNAGTIEFLVNENEEFYFLEMNTRIQVEHTITEEILGIDIVEHQILIAEGHALRLSQDEIKVNGFAMQARLYAEDPANNFAPSPGKIEFLNLTPHNARMDTWIQKPMEISGNYDPMIVKIITKGYSRKQVVTKLQKALEEIKIFGIQTNISFLQNLIHSQAFLQNAVNTFFIEENSNELAVPKIHLIKSDTKNSILKACLASLLLFEPKSEQNENYKNPWVGSGYWRHLMIIDLNIENIPFKIKINHWDRKFLSLEMDGVEQEVHVRMIDKNHFLIQHEGVWENVVYFGQTAHSLLVDIKGEVFTVNRTELLDETMVLENLHGNESDDNTILSPFHGKIIKLEITDNQIVKKGKTLLILESMKLENKIAAPFSCKVEKIEVIEGDQVKANQVLIRLQKIEIHDNEILQ